MPSAKWQPLCLSLKVLTNALKILLRFSEPEVHMLSLSLQWVMFQNMDYHQNRN